MQVVTLELMILEHKKTLQDFTLAGYFNLNLNSKMDDYLTMKYPKNKSMILV